MNRFCFQSSKFKPVPNEEKYTNPGIYGKECAEWLANELKNIGYTIKEIVPEDWGWCIILDGFDTYSYWIGCNGEYYDDHLIWSCFVSVDEPFFKNPFKTYNKNDVVKSIEADVLKILNENFVLIECP